MKVLLEGTRLVIGFAERHNGDTPAEEWFNTQPARKQAALYATIQQVAARGSLSNRERFRVLKGEHGVVEFKHHQHRLMGVMKGQVGNKGRLVLTNGFLKKKDETPRSEIERAHERFEEDLSVEAGRGGIDEDE